MPSRYGKKRRFYKSKFDPYIIEIARYAAMGLTTQEIAELIEYHFDDIVSKDALYAFMRSRGIQSMVTMGGTNLEYEAPKCEKCKSCHMVLSFDSKSKIRICKKANRVIGWSVKTSPMWCEKRGVSGVMEKVDAGRI